jgi:hypothetical protein
MGALSATSLPFSALLRTALVLLQEAGEGLVVLLRFWPGIIDLRGRNQAFLVHARQIIDICPQVVL